MSTTFRDDAPQLVIDVDREKVAALGIPLTDVFNAMEVYLGSEYVNDFDYLNRSYRVYVQADTPFRNRSAALDRIYVRTNGTDPQPPRRCPLSNLVHTHVERVAPIITHYNLMRSIEINGIPAPGYGSGHALSAMTAAAQTLPNGIAYEWTGISLEQIEFGSQAIVIFGLGLLCVFLVLAANYENYSDPLIILVSVPLAILGAILALDVRSLPSDLYAQVGYLMLIALASKNAILIVEFANQRRRAGLSATEAVRDAAQTRLRPILMTSLAFILATVPLVVASRRRRRQPPFAGHRGVRRHGALDGAEPVRRAGRLRRDRRTARPLRARPCAARDAAARARERRRPAGTRAGVGLPRRRRRDRAALRRRQRSRSPLAARVSARR